jgi:hypothetical protein
VRQDREGKPVNFQPLVDAAEFLTICLGLMAICASVDFLTDAFVKLRKKENQK